VVLTWCKEATAAAATHLKTMRETNLREHKTYKKERAKTIEKKWVEGPNHTDFSLHHY
jgi:hypothetical protein